MTQEKQKADRTLITIQSHRKKHRLKAYYIVLYRISMFDYCICMVSTLQNYLKPQQYTIALLKVQQMRYSNVLTEWIGLYNIGLSIRLVRFI